jgi:serine/threonine protein kinase
VLTEEDRDRRLVDAILEIAVGLDTETRSDFLTSSCPARLGETARRSLADVTRTLPAHGREAPRAGGLPFEFLDEFRILARLGQGGMGEVYLAEDTILRRFVALKTLPRRLAGDERLVERLSREAITVARLRHPGIVPVHKVSDGKAVAYLVMDYIAGSTLKDELDALRVLPEHARTEALRSREYLHGKATLLARIAEALHYAHDHGIVHRDV